MPKLRASTVSTNVVRVEVKDEQATSVNITSTGANMTPSYEFAQAMIDLKTEKLKDGMKGIVVGMTTIATAARVNITVIRDRFASPANRKGLQYVEVPNT